MSIVEERENIKYSLLDYIPYIDVIDNKIFLEDESVAFVLKINFINDDNLSNDELHNELFDKVCNFLNTLNEDLYCQFIFKKHTYFDDLIQAHLNINKSQNPLVNEIFNKRIDKVKNDITNRKLFRYDLYLIIKKKYNYKMENPKLLIYSPLKITKEMRVNFLNIIKQVNEIEELIINALEKASINVEVPKEQQVIDLITTQINMRSFTNIEFNKKTDLICSDLYKYPNYLYINNQYVRYISLKNNTEPENVFPTLIKHLTRANLNFEYDLFINFKMLNRNSEINKLKRSRALARGLKYNLVSKDVDEEKQLRENEISQLLVDMAESGKENLFSFELFLAIKADNIEELNKRSDNILTAFKQMEGSQGFKESIANFKLYIDNLPGNISLTNFRNFKFRTSYLACLLPIFGPPYSKDEPMFLFRNLYNSITPINPLSEQFINKNGIVIGSSGSGKSFLTNNISLGYLGEDPIIFIVEKGSSFEKFVKTFGGEFFKISLDESDYRINPFDISLDNSETGNENDPKYLFYQSILEVMIRDGDKPITNDDKIVLEEAIAKTQNIKTPIISDFLEAIKSLDFSSNTLNETKDKIQRHLARWTKGVRGQFFNNRESKFKVSNDVIGIDLKGLENYPDILEIFMFYISSLCWKKVESDRRRKKLLIFDEAWSLFLSDQGSQLLVDLYRTLRKYGGSLISISQSISDFADNAFSAAIMTNISFFYILEQADGTNFNQLQSFLNLSDQDIVQIKQLRGIKGQYSEIFMKMPDKKFVGRLVPSPFEYWVSTTDSNDIVALNEVLKKKDIITAVNELALAYPNGI